jgi:NADPH-dependent curcumin reductase CurA
MPVSSREIRLKRRPIGLPSAEDFELASVALTAPQTGQVLVRNHWMSVDPYMRGRMYDRPSYVPPFALGEALQGGAIGEVIESQSPDFTPGDLVESMFGWREAYVAPAGALTKLPKTIAPPQAFLGVLGMPGMTAYGGLLEIGQPKAGDVVFVSGAAGAVGATVCQIAKIKGCTVIGSVGSNDKAAWLKERGVDAVINYKTCGDLTAALKATAPKGIDVYFDNVGGEHLEAALEVARPFARLVECGMISAYNDTEPKPGPRNLIYVVGKSLRMQGFIVTQFLGLRDQFVADMAGWIADGRLTWQETVIEGVDNAPAAFLGLFAGANTGKMLVKLA